jgi:ABC-type molybdenum transport system ATPase subunit/photorepair protein PhrA
VSIPSIVVRSDIKKTPRVIQLTGIFDIPFLGEITKEIPIDFDPGDDWNIGLILGPSGSGKTTILREVFDYNGSGYDWESGSIIDDFPKEKRVSEIVEVLSSVGFSSPPSWLKPYSVLSNGEKFRSGIARCVLESDDLIVIDEFTSVVDRVVAKACSVSLSKYIRRSDRKVVLASCHEDIVEWLEPDWIYKPGVNEFYSGRYLHRRPRVALSVGQVSKDAWKLFSEHHYLSSELKSSSQCYCGFWDNVPVVFCAVNHMPHPKVRNFKREHRLVCLPDYQGMGFGMKMSEFIASYYKGNGFRYISITSHPGIISYRKKSSNWSMTRRKSIVNPIKSSSGAVRNWKKSQSDISLIRSTASFEYVGDSRDISILEPL